MNKENVMPYGIATGGPAIGGHGNWNGAGGTGNDTGEPEKTMRDVARGELGGSDVPLPPDITYANDVYLGPGTELPDLLNIGAFSPEMILQYVQIRLADIDGQMADIMGDANDKKAKSEELRKFQDAVRSLSGVGSKGAGFDTSDVGNDTEPATANSDAITRLEQPNAELNDNPE